MSINSLDKKRGFIISMLTSGKNNSMSIEEANVVLSVIDEIADSVGFIGENLSLNDEINQQRKHKYDVWIAKEVKKNREVLEKQSEIRLIIDWAIHDKADLFSYDFERAIAAQEEWHQRELERLSIRQITNTNVDNDRVVFRFSDQEHFLYLLKDSELDFEGMSMGHCVSGEHYKSKVNKELSLILSLRDSNNLPHVTIEIDVKSGRVIQQYGKGNKEPVAKYIRLIKEFVLYSANFPELEDKEVLKFLNLHLI